MVKETIGLLYLREEGTAPELGGILPILVYVLLEASTRAGRERWTHSLSVSVLHFFFESLSKHFFTDIIFVVLHYLVHFCVSFGKLLEFQEEGERITLRIVLGSLCLLHDGPFTWA